MRSEFDALNAHRLPLVEAWYERTITPAQRKVLDALNDRCADLGGPMAAAVIDSLQKLMVQRDVEEVKPAPRARL